MSKTTPSLGPKFWVAAISIIAAVVAVAMGTFAAGTFMERRGDDIENRVPNE